ncbi:hypothetical protein ACJJI3_19415 [Microbulbifer sp. ZKSA004]|uniref:hypothetical protein n=1 Tax=Microbulbifer sp. ZKSA004 TaxID=3243389 RepID=UPI0040399438
MNEQIPRKKTWIFYLVQFLTFGPMLGLVLFILYIIREQAIPMILVAVSGVGLGNAVQCLILRGLSGVNEFKAHFWGYLVGGLASLVITLYFYSLGTLPYISIIASLAIVYALFVRFTSNV